VRFLALIAVITHGFTHRIAVLLLDKAIIALAARTASGELDTVQAAPVFELAAIDSATGG
jgi:hypothetical protein